jgi:hypothetical protein
MKPRVSLRKSLSDKQLLGGILDGASWLPWRSLLLASMGEALLDDEREVFTKLTGRAHEPGQMVEEFIGVKGRRAGGSRSASVLGSYIGGLCTHPSLVRGERGVLLMVAADQRQADVVLNYTEANFRNSPVLSQLIESRTARELRLTNGIDIEVRAADFKRLRGLTFVAAVADEIAFWPTDDAANADNEILDAIRPGLATTGGPLFMISSPYARRGELWRAFTKHYGAAGDPLILVAKGSSRDFNATLPESVVARAFERDAAAASAEFGGEFRKDIDSPFNLEAVQAVVDRGVYERSPMRGVNYDGFIDPSGGSADSFTLGVSHTDRSDWQKPVVVVDCVREQKPPFSPSDVAEEFAAVLKSYNIVKIVGDKFAGLWPVEVFAKLLITYEQSASPKSDLYRDLLPLINSQRIRLLDNAKLISQLVGLERRVARGGRDSIDHGPSGHDDVANCVAGVASLSNQYPGYLGGDLYDLWCN